MSIVNFQNPPLFEVFFNVGFDDVNFVSIHYGSYWETIKNRFPFVQDRRPVIEESEEEGELVIELSSLPRVVFISVDNKTAIQLQGNFFSYNWKRRNQENYPNFENVYREFLSEWNHFNEWASNAEIEEIKPSRYELTYINFIQESSGWSTALDHSKVFTFFGGEYSTELGVPLFHDARLAFLLPNDMGVLDIEVDQRSFGKEQENFNFVLFKLTAKKINADIGLREWFELAHEHIIKIFLRLTKEEAKKRWGLS